MSLRQVDSTVGSTLSNGLTLTETPPKDPRNSNPDSLGALQDNPQRKRKVVRVTAQATQEFDDFVATEEPLEIRIVFGPPSNRRSKSLSITMRTPGHDQELAIGFLRSENLIARADQVQSTEFVGPKPEHGQHGNTLMVELAPEVNFDPEKLQRNFYMTSSCGVCGKASIDAVLAQGFETLKSTITVPRGRVFELPGMLRKAQSVFESTGGIHASGLFNVDGGLLVLREDVGRHNAVDKLVGYHMRVSGNEFPCPGKILVVSGRSSFELVQKSLAAQFEMLVGVGAPSSLAVELANQFNLTLVGFASDKRFNVYSGIDRIQHV